MKLIYKILTLFCSAIIIAALVWVLTPLPKDSITPNYWYTLFDSTFTIRMPFKLTDDSLRFIRNPVEDTAYSSSHSSQNFEFTIECIKFKVAVPDKSKKSFLNTWLTSLDSTSQSVSTLKKESLLRLRTQKYEFYDGIINYSKEYRPTGHKTRYFSTLIASKKEYLYFLDIRYNDPDRKTMDIRDKIFNSIKIR